jgi:pilus assembly protein CpaB
MKKIRVRSSRYYTTVAVVLAVISGTLFYTYLSSLSASLEAGEMVEVVVAARDIPARTILSFEMLKLEELPKKWVNADSFSSRNGLIGLATALPIFKGEPILARKLALKRRDEGLASLISRGERGFTLVLEEGNPILRELRPGNRVDVLVTLNGDVTGKPVTKTVLQQKEIMAIGSSSPFPVTLLVSPIEAEKLAFAQASGKIALVLCPTEREKMPKLSGISADDL